MLIRRQFIFILGFALFACSKSGPVAPTQLVPTEMTDQEYDVLAALIDSVYPHSPDSILVVRDSTDAGIHAYNQDSILAVVLLEAQQHLPSLSRETMTDFRRKNHSATYIQNPLRIDSTFVRASATGRIYPAFTVGRVGFGFNGEQALAYVGHIAAPLAGEGVYYLLSVEQGKWRVTGSHLIWIS
jgi:hypothetical protein